MTRGDSSGSESEASPTTLDRRPGRRALVGWSITTVVLLLPTVLSVIAVIRAWQAPPTAERVSGQSSAWTSSEPSITVGTSAGLTQLFGPDEYSPIKRQAIMHLGADLVVSGANLSSTKGIDALRVRSVARNGEKLAFAFASLNQEAHGVLVIDRDGDHELRLADDQSWLTGLRAEGDAFAGYVAHIEVEGADGSQHDRETAFLRAMTGDVKATLRTASIDPTGVHLGPEVDLSPLGGKWVSTVTYVNGAPVFGLGRGFIGGSNGYASPNGSPVALPERAFSASALAVGKDGGTFVTKNGEARPVHLRQESGLRLCSAEGNELEPIDETLEGDELTVSACGHVFRARRDAKGVYREARADDQPWRPLGSGLRYLREPVVDRIGDRWIVRDTKYIATYNDAVVFDLRGERMHPPSKMETMRRLAGVSTNAMFIGVGISWTLALAAVGLFIRGIRRLREVRIARASPTSPRPGVYTGMLMDRGRKLRIMLGSRVTEHIARLGPDWPRQCSFSGAPLEEGRVQLVASEQRADPDAATSFREAAHTDEGTLIPATDPPIIGFEAEAEPYVSRAFRPFVWALILSVPLPFALFVMLGLGPY